MALLAPIGPLIFVALVTALVLTLGLGWGSSALWLALVPLWAYSLPAMMIHSHHYRRAQQLVASRLGIPQHVARRIELRGTERFDASIAACTQGAVTAPGKLTSEEVRAAERALSIERFPEDYRTWLMTHNGLERWFGETYLVLYSLENVITLTQAAEAQERLPGYVAIGSDGGGEALAFDFRKTPPPVVMVNAVCSGWDEGLLQATSFAEFMTHQEAEAGFRWHEPHQ